MFSFFKRKRSQEQDDKSKRRDDENSSSKKRSKQKKTKKKGGQDEVVGYDGSVTTQSSPAVRSEAVEALSAGNSLTPDTLTGPNSSRAMGNDYSQPDVSRSTDQISEKDVPHPDNLLSITPSVLVSVQQTKAENNNSIQFILKPTDTKSMLTSENDYGNIDTSEEKVIVENEKNSVNDSISECSKLIEQPATVISKQEDIEEINCVTDNVVSSEIAAGTDSYCTGTNLSGDEATPANENQEEKSVTGIVASDISSLANSGAVASYEEYSSGNIPGVECKETYVVEKSDEDMQRARSYTDCLEKVCDVMVAPDVLIKSVTGPDNGGYRDHEQRENRSDSEETSEDESSESEENSDSEDNVIKNDSGCWDKRIFSSESDLQVTVTASLSSVNSILLQDGKHSKEKKHVTWADIDWKRDLTYEKENTDTVAEDSSDQEESGSEDEEESEEDSEEQTEVPTEDPVDYKREDTWLDVKSSSSEESSSEEDSEDEEEDENEEDTARDSTKSPLETSISVSVLKKDDEVVKQDEEYESEDETSGEENDNQPQLENEEPKPSALRIEFSGMQERIAELQKDLDYKSTNINRLQTELDTACNESELVRQRFKRLEEDLESYRQTNKQLIERLHVSERTEVDKMAKGTRELERAEKRIRDLEEELEKVKLNYTSVQTSYQKLKADRDMEVQIIQKALEKALTDQEEMESKYEKEFENLRTLNSSREVQMLEDFEWKLREVERNCKKKVLDYESDYERKTLDLASQLAAAQADLDQISHLKLCEIELNQLKQTSSEQRKNLRLVNRKYEELQVSEKILQEEVNTLRSSLDKEKAHIIALQTMHREELADKEKKMKLKLELEINQLTCEWEERLRKENYRIKTDLENKAREEKRAAVETVRKLKDDEIEKLKQNWEKKSQEFKNEIVNYKKKIIETEENHKNVLDNAQTNADRDVFDLRRKMDKLDMSYQEKIEKIEEEHEAEMEKLKDECEKRVQQCEANLQIQIGNSRTTLELVKQQLRNEAQLKLEQVEKEYHQKLEQQRIELEKEKESALELLNEKHQKSMEAMCKELERTKKLGRNEIDNLLKKRNQSLSNQSLRQQIKNETDNGHSQSLIRRLEVAEVAEEMRTQGKEEVLQRSIEQLTKQLNAGKIEIEKLRQQLEARQQQQQTNHHQQQRNPQQPVPNPRRNRKGRSARN